MGRHPECVWGGVSARREGDGGGNAGVSRGTDFTGCQVTGLIPGFSLRWGEQEKQHHPFSQATGDGGEKQGFGGRYAINSPRCKSRYKECISCSLTPLENISICFTGGTLPHLFRRHPQFLYYLCRSCLKFLYFGMQ